MEPAFIVVNKPRGMSSRQAVDRVKRLVRPAKVGHAGTLDPLAEGVLVVAISSATRLIEYIQQMPKRYRGTFLLGRESPTEDCEGEIRELVDPPIPSLDEVRAAAANFVGPIMQRPPIFSALKVAGRRAYELARKGRDVELAPREVVIHRLEVAGYAYPELVLDIECEGGTYVRSLGRDLAESLGTAAVMSTLIRTAIGDFRIEDACSPDGLTAELLGQWLLPAVRAVAHLPQVVLSDAEAAEVANGRFVARGLIDIAPGAVGTVGDFADSEEYAGLDSAGRLIAVLTPRAGGKLGARLNLVCD